MKAPAEIVENRATVMFEGFENFWEGLLNVSKLKTVMLTLYRLGYARRELRQRFSRRWAPISS